MLALLLSSADMCLIKAGGHSGIEPGAVKKGGLRVMLAIGDAQDRIIEYAGSAQAF